MTIRRHEICWHKLGMYHQHDTAGTAEEVLSVTHQSSGMHNYDYALACDIFKQTVRARCICEGAYQTQ